MTRIRFLFLCLLMLTVPFQGFAATAMIMCATAPSHHTEVQDSRSHHNDVEQEQASTADSQSSDSQKFSPDVTHKCGVCAACCSAAAINSYSHVPTVLAPASTLRADTLVSIYSVHPQHPEKPPRV